MRSTKDDTAITAIIKLGERLDAYQTGGKQAQILSREAFADARAVFDAANLAGLGGPAFRLAICALGRFHWALFSLLTGEEAEEQLQMALNIFEQLAGDMPDVVPEDALEMLRSGSRVPGLPCEAERAARRVDLARETDDEALFNDALTTLARVVARMPKNDPEVLWARAELAKGWRERAEALRDLPSARRAVEIGEQLVAPPFDTHPLLPSLLSDVALAWLALFRISGEQDDLRCAVDRARRSTSVPADPDAGANSRILSNAAIIFSAASDATDLGKDVKPDRSDIVDLHRVAAEATPFDDDDLPGRLANLGRDLFRENRRTGDPRQLDECIAALQRALSIAPPDHRFLSGIHFILAGSHLVRYVESPDPHATDLDAAIDHERTALELERRSPSGRVGPDRIAANLASMLRLRYQVSGDLDDLEEAMEREAEA